MQSALRQVVNPHGSTWVRWWPLLLIILLLWAPVQVASAETLRRGLGPEPDSLDIHQAQGLAAINLLRDLREGLVTFDANGEPAPGVAASWQVFDEGRRYEFTLRKDATWSNGERVTAADFVRAWRKALAPESLAVTSGLLRDIHNATAVSRAEAPAEALGIQALAEDRLQLILDRPAPWLLEILAHPVSYPLHASMGDEIRNDPVNGAFTLGDWVPRSVLKLQRNPAFHAAADVSIETVEYYPIEEPATELARYRAGELDITETIPAGRYGWIRENLAADLRVSPYLGSYWLSLNLRRAPLGESAKLRRALALAIDRETLVRIVLGAGELPGWSVVPPGMTGYTPQRMPEVALSQAERNAEAQGLLLAAGYGKKLPRLELRYNTSGLNRRIAVAVAAMWKQVLGISTELINEEWKVFVNNRRLGVVTQVFRGGWIADYADPASFLDLFVSGNEMNSTFFSDSEYDGLMAAASQASGNQRTQLLQLAETRILETLPVIPLYYYVSRHLVSPRIGGFYDNLRDVHLSRYLIKEVP